LQVRLGNGLTFVLAFASAGVRGAPMPLATELIQREMTRSVVQAQVAQVQIDALRCTAFDRYASGDASGRLHRLEVRIEQERLQIALVRARELQRRELELQRLQRRLRIERDAREAARLQHARVVDLEPRDVDDLAVFQAAARVEHECMRPEIQEDRLKVSLPLPGLNVDIETGLARGALHFRLQPQRQFVARERATLIVRRHIRELRIDVRALHRCVSALRIQGHRDDAAGGQRGQRHVQALRESEKNIDRRALEPRASAPAAGMERRLDARPTVAEPQAVDGEIECAVLASVHDAGCERLSAETGPVQRDSRARARDRRHSDLDARAVDPDVAPLLPEHPQLRHMQARGLPGNGERHGEAGRAPAIAVDTLDVEAHFVESPHRAGHCDACEQRCAPSSHSCALVCALNFAMRPCPHGRVGGWSLQHCIGGDHDPGPRRVASAVLRCNVVARN
jgi:hypothetical protein